MTMNNMKEELKQVRYYYAKKDHFDKIENEIDITPLKKVVQKYNQAMVGAEPKLIDVYHALYIEGMSQLDLAIEWSFTPEYIRMMSRQLNKYLLDKLNKEGA